MTPAARIAASLPLGRWLTVADVQRRVASDAREIWPAQHLAVRLGLMASRGVIEKADQNGRSIYRRTAQ